MGQFAHTSVLFEEAIDSLGIRPDGVYVDGTAGGGGHSAAILQRLEGGRLVSIDQDPDAIEAITKRFGQNPHSVIVQGNFSQIKDILDRLGIPLIDGLLLDIGVSSHQLDTPERGFSYHHEAPLDMRMSQSGVSAAQLVNTMSWQELAEVFSRYGEEKFAKPIAKAIVRQRELSPVETTIQLADIIREAVPQKARRDGHPARKCFQALRIAVNGELNHLEVCLKDAFERLRPGGRISVITFHSLEDRLVKRQFQEWCQGCTCPRDFPVCVCGNRPRARLLTRKAVEPSEQEIAQNKRSRSARLRTVIKLDTED